MRLIFDIETNGLLDDLTKVHCICVHDLDTGTDHGFTSGDINAGVGLLAAADELIGHNILTFDIPALQKVFPYFEPPPIVTDTLVLSRLLFPDLRERHFKFAAKNPDFPKQLIGRHSLEAWGAVHGTMKGDYKQIMEEQGRALGLKGKELSDYVWGELNDAMFRYCEQDVRVTKYLYERLMKREPTPESSKLEHRVAEIIWRQERYGWYFDVDAAVDLAADLSARRGELEAALADMFPPWEVSTPFTPKRNNKTRGYVAGETVYKTEIVEFNPGSRDHIALKLREQGWEPRQWTPGGKPQVDEEVLRDLEFPAAKLLEEYFIVQKRLGQLSEGPQAWLKKVTKEGLIHGRVNTMGAATFRMTHSHPNLAQVPSNRAPYGERCRALFQARPGKVLVGCDADGLEGRCLAHYMGDSKFTDMILNGRKEDGTDLHSLNAGILGCSRDDAKTWFYAFIYGAGAGKLGSILHRGPAAGTASKRKFMQALPALGRLVRRVGLAAQHDGYLKGLDGRRVPIRSQHAALNTLLQSAGALIMKKALVILDDRLQAEGWVPGKDYEFVGNIHDEFQMETTHERADLLGQMAVESIREAGGAFKLRCPLDGSYATGRTWAETH